MSKAAVARAVSMMALVSAAALPLPGHADTFPARPVRMVDGFAAGGNTDVLARTLARRLSETWGQPVVVDNRPGASGNVGAETVARATPNGYTLLMGWTTTIAISRVLYPKLRYDAAKDLKPVALTASSLLVLLAHPSVPAKSVQELIALAKSKPGGLSYASAGAGTGTHIAAELFKLRAGIDVVHVPYKGGAPGAAAVGAGEVQVGFASLAASRPLLQAGRVVALAVTSPQRAVALQQVPTIAESGFPGFDLTTWYGLFAPAGTPDSVVQRLNADISTILREPDVVARLRDLGLEARTAQPKQFSEIFAQEMDLYAKVIRETKISLN